jgi:chlorite dismutase
MNNEYVIINKTELLKRIEELEKVEQELIKSGHKFAVTRGKIDELISLLSQSTSLIPEIEKAFEAGIDAKLLSVAKINCTVEDYISNLKLGI